jgi:crotonobetainyl-CoA hydratase
VAPEPVAYARQGAAGVITIDRPERRNAVDGPTADALDAAYHTWVADQAARVLVVTGAGGKAFCAGADLKAVGRGERMFPEGREDWGFAGYVSHPVSVPTIAAVNGFALGGGTELALASDLVVAAETAMFGLPEVKRGLIAGAGGAFRLPAQLPPKIAMELLLTGEPIDAATAQRLGLVNRVVAADKVLEEALALAEVISANAPLSVQASKRVARGVIDGRVPSEEAAWAQNAVETAAVMRSDDAKEGPRAFAEKRAPVWSAR